MYEWIQGELGKLGIAISENCVTNIHHPQKPSALRLPLNRGNDRPAVVIVF